MLAIDRGSRMLYQLSPNLYEIRVFTLNGDPIRTIVPPVNYLTRPPNIEHDPSGGIGIGPSDTLDDIAVLPDGSITVSGGLVENSAPQGSQMGAGASYSRFLDTYDASGKFQRRIPQSELTLEGTPFRGIDHHTGRAYFGKGNVGLEATLGTR